VSGLVAIFYQGIYRVLPRHWALLTAVTLLLAAAVAITMTWLR
jgi:hypothetical protein